MLIEKVATATPRAHPWECQADAGLGVFLLPVLACRLLPLASRMAATAPDFTVGETKRFLLARKGSSLCTGLPRTGPSTCSLRPAWPLRRWTKVKSCSWSCLLAIREYQSPQRGQWAGRIRASGGQSLSIPTCSPSLRVGTEPWRGVTEPLQHSDHSRGTGAVEGQDGSREQGCTRRGPLHEG